VFSRLCPVAIAIAVLTPLTAPCNDVHTTIELVVADLGASPADDPAWGWWNASKYDAWSATGEDDAGPIEGRVLVTGETYATLFNAERYPELDAAASWTDVDSGETIRHDLTAELEVYDLAVAQRFEHDNESAISPWVGATLMNIDESRAVPGAANPARETASSELWGLVLGADGELVLHPQVAISARAVVRWAQGTRRARLRADVPDPDSGDPAATDVVLSDTTERAMYGADLGVRWRAATAFQLEAGWRYRDWQFDDGPASFDGPYARLVVTF